MLNHQVGTHLRVKSVIYKLDGSFQRFFTLPFQESLLTNMFSASSTYINYKIFITDRLHVLKSDKI